MVAIVIAEAAVAVVVVMAGVVAVQISSRELVSFFLKLTVPVVVLIVAGKCCGWLTDVSVIQSSCCASS